MGQGKKSEDEHEGEAQPTEGCESLEQFWGYMGDCQNYGPFLGPYYNTGPNTGPNLWDPKRDHNFDNPPYELPSIFALLRGP